MRDLPYAQSKLFGWLLVVASFYIFGSALSSIASMFGFTNFPNDHRGEWAILVAPIMLLLSAALGFIGLRRLTRPPKVARWQILLVALAVTGASFIWVTWQFANAA